MARTKTNPAPTGTLARVEDMVLQSPSGLRPQMDDLITIGVAHAEQLLNERISGYVRQAEELDQRAAQETKALNASLEQAALMAHKANFDRLAAAGSPFGIKFELKVESGHNRVLVRIYGSSPDEGGYQIWATVIEYDEAAKAKQEAIQGIHKEAEKARCKALDARRRKADLASIERATRARVASQALARTDDGKTVLERIRAEVEQSIADV